MYGILLQEQDDDDDDDDDGDAVMHTHIPRCYVKLQRLTTFPNNS